MPNKNKLSIYLIKDDFTTDESIIEDGISLLTEIPNVGKVYYKPSNSSTPSWVSSFFDNSIYANGIFTANAKVALIARISIPSLQEESPPTIKTFAIIMGHGKTLLKDDVIVERFGLKVVLNTIKRDSLRRINKVNIGGNQKTSNEQLPLKSEIGDFGFDIDRDLISLITGTSEDETYASGNISGGDILSLHAEVDITNVISFLERTYQKYCLTTYTRNFPWIDHIQCVKDSRRIELLNTQLLASINNNDGCFWMAVPEVIEWQNISGFKYNGSTIYDDIYIDVVKDSFRADLTEISQLKTKQIQVISALDGNITRWMAYRCIYGEIELDGKAYCINGGKWYCINSDFVSQVTQEYLSTDICDIHFDEFTENHSSENDYSTAFVQNYADDYICMDKENISYGGGHSAIELCDILSKDRQFIHIKPYSGSSTLSHLFNQATVSAELIVSDHMFVEKANRKIATKSVREEFIITRPSSKSIVFGIISKKDCERPLIPFFSKVAFRYAKRRLEAFGFSVSIKNIRNVKLNTAN